MTDPTPNREAIDVGLRELRFSLARIADKAPNDQPAYPDGMRPFGTGDLRHFIEVLDAALTRNSTDQEKPEGVAIPDGMVEPSDEYFITKGGMYYRQNAEGYTLRREHAGRFTLDEAILHSHPNGPDGPRDGIRHEPAPPRPTPSTTHTGEGEVERVREAGKAAVERLAHVRMELDLGEWSRLSCAILAGLGVEPYVSAALSTPDTGGEADEPVDDTPTSAEQGADVAALDTEGEAGAICFAICAVTGWALGALFT